MHIGFDAKRIFFNGSGLGNYSRSSVDNLCNYYPENKYTLFVPRRGGDFSLKNKQCADIIYPSGVNALAPSVWRSYAMSGSINQSGIDIYHGLSNELPNDIRQSHVKSVVTIHDLIFIRFPKLYKSADRLLYRQKYGHSCRIADHVIAISEQTKADAVNYWDVDPSKISVVYQGCDPSFYEQRSQMQLEAVRQKYNLPDEFVLSVGSIETRKNLKLTLEAMVAGKLDIFLVACGKWTPYADLLMHYASRNGISHRVKFLHNVGFADLPSIYQLSSAVVYASIFEGFGIPIIEALNSRVPVITSMGGVFTETGGDACYYIDPFDVDSMIDGINNVLGDAQLRQRMIEAGLVHAAKFREDETSKNMMNVYRKLL